MFSKGSSKTQRPPQKVTLSVKSYTKDKSLYGVPIKRGEANRVEENLGSLQTQPIDINMDYRPYRTAGRLSLGSLEERPN